MCALQFALLAAVLVNGCMTPSRQRIGYSVDDVVDLSGGPLAKMTLFVRPFVDQRTPAVSDSSSWHETGAAGYEQQVGFRVTTMMVAHLVASHMFRSVSCDPAAESGADLMLIGSIRTLHARKESKPLAEAAALQPGTIASGIAVLATSPRLEGETVLGDIQLIDRGSGRLIWHGEAIGKIEGEAVVGNTDADLARAANASLRAAIDDLLIQMSDLQLPRQ